jgi:hypothetical protein
MPKPCYPLCKRRIGQEERNAFREKEVKRDF